MHALRTLIKDIDKSHRRLGKLIATNLLCVKAKLCILNVSPAGCGKEEYSIQTPLPKPRRHLVTYAMDDTTQPHKICSDRHHQSVHDRRRIEIHQSNISGTKAHQKETQQLCGTPNHRRLRKRKILMEQSLNSNRHSDLSTHTLRPQTDTIRRNQYKQTPYQIYTVA